MAQAFKKFWNNEEGLGTLEVILIVAVLVGIAILFRNQIIEWVNKILGSTDSQIDQFDAG
ncbi:Flp1 family type IVb pilin [Caldalkalibacillus salinus]|uniref:Flp1 family type IVb pilin n=1 Tax=Caldalkalibacillus salinus TaxID=2803787 RepID=UPI00192345DD|nr:Flp1 family type IVb pilin [Caldalkalibacillus salinus]